MTRDREVIEAARFPATACCPVFLGSRRRASRQVNADSILSNTMAGFEAGFRVSHIAAFGLATCSPREEVSSVLSKLALKGFDRIPVKDGCSALPRHVGHPFQREPDFGVTSVNYNFVELVERAEAPA